MLVARFASSLRAGDVEKSCADVLLTFSQMILWGWFQGIKKKAIPFQEWLKASDGGRPALCTAVTLFAAIRGKNGPCLLIRLRHD